MAAAVRPSSLEYKQPSNDVADQRHSSSSSSSSVSWWQQFSRRPNRDEGKLHVVPGKGAGFSK